MTSATLTSKGQLTLPKDIRDRLGVDTGDQISFVVREDGVVELRAKTIDLLSLRGRLKPKVRGVTVGDMERAIMEGALGKRRR